VGQISTGGLGQFYSGANKQHIDALYIPADNTAQTNANIIIGSCTKRHVPVFTGDPGIVEMGAVGSVGTNYEELGRENGRQAAAILGGTAPQDIPVVVVESGQLFINMRAAGELGIVVPQSLVRQAVGIYNGYQ
jgi:putative ABC transport system substrate-binding protein